MYLVVSEFDILPKSLGGKSNCNLYFVSVFGTLSYGMASFMRPIWLKSNLCNAIPTTCLVTIEIQRGCCQKGHLKMIHIYQCLFVPLYPIVIFHTSDFESFHTTIEFLVYKKLKDKPLKNSILKL